MVNLRDLKQRQALPLKAKINLTNRRIRDWYEHYNGNVYISFSGGKDSTVLLYLVRKLYPEVPAVFCDTGLEYPEIKDFVKTFNNVITIRPKMNFKQVLDKYGFPVVSKKVARQIRDLQNPTKNNENSRKLYLKGIKKDGTKSNYFKLPNKWHKLINAPFKVSEKCCDVMKKKPLKEYEKQSKRTSFVGTMAKDSRQRQFSYIKTGCSNFKVGKCMPISFWLEKDIWSYIKQKKLKYCKVYDTGVTNTGCIYCMFGVHLEGEPNRFQCMQKSHPQLYSYCLNKLGLKEVLRFINVNYKLTDGGEFFSSQP